MRLRRVIKQCIVVVLTCLVLGAYTGGVSISHAIETRATDNVAVTFPDPNLEATIRETIGIPTVDIYRSELEEITKLKAVERDISNPAWSFYDMGHIPTISSMWPNDETIDVAINAEISATFSEAMDRESVESAFSLSPAVSGTFNWGDNGMTFTPSYLLSGGTTYTISIDNTAKDLDGNFLENSFTLSFTTCERPVILVHGLQLFSLPYNPVDKWIGLAEILAGNSIVNKELVADSDHIWYRLAGQGPDTFTVYISNYAHDTDSPTFGDIRLYAQNLAEEIERVKEDTGFNDVDIVAHSMGGLVARAYIENEDFPDNPYGTSYQNDVGRLVMLGTPNHGSPYGQIFAFVSLISDLEAVQQMEPSSEFLSLLNSGYSGTDVGVDYFTIAGDFYRCSVFKERVAELFRCALFYEDHDGVVSTESVRLDSVESYTCGLTHFDLRTNDYVCENVKNILLSQPVFFEQSHSFAFACPVHVTVTDEHGSSISDTGTSDIPDASMSVDEVSEVTIFYLPTDTAYTVNISGYETGDFTLIEQLPFTGDRTLINIFQDIPVTDKTEATLEIVPGEVDRTMAIDADGNGTIDEQKSPDESRIISTLTEEGFNWWLIVGIAGAVVIIGFASYLLISRRS